MKTIPSLEQGGRRRNILFMVLGGVFLSNAIIAELIGGKLFQVPTPWRSLVTDPDSTWRNFTLSCGIILWPVVFITSDIINEYFGREGVKRLSFLGAAMIAYAFVALWLTDAVPAVSFSPVDAASFRNVFMQSAWIIVGSITAFLVAQLIDVTVFWLVRRRTGHRYLWMRATGSTLVSQLVDTVIVQFIGLYLPHVFNPERGLTFWQTVNSAGSGYIFKFAVAIGVTPILYLLHAIIDAYLGEEANQMIESTAHREQAADTDVKSHR